MDRIDDFDIAVIGAGPVGLTAANLLADEGLRVLLVERNACVSDEPRAISITDESLRVMAQIGIVAALEPEMLMDTGARYYGRKGQLLAEVKARVPRLGHPVKSQFDQPVLARLLHAAAAKRPGVELRFRTEATNLRQTAAEVLFDTAGPGGHRTARARWLVACDGGRSPVRTQVGIELHGSTQLEKWIVVDILGSTVPAEPYSQFHCNGVRPCVVVPGVKGRCRFEFMLLPTDDEQKVVSPDFIVGLVAPYQAIRREDIRRAAVYVAQQRIASTYRRGRVLLAGDAAHLMPPFAGQGLNAGVRDVANLSWKLAACVRGQAHEALVDTYEAERRPHAADMVRLSTRIGKVVMSTSAAATTVRDGLLAALGLFPPAKQWIVGMKFLKQPCFATGCVVPPDATLPPAAAALVGRALPQPRVRLGDGSATLLDPLLGRGWALLSIPDRGALVVERVEAGAKALTTFDPQGCFDSMAGHDLVIVVRPDRYVAAVGPRARVGETLAPLNALVSVLATSAAALATAPAAGGRPAAAATPVSH